MMKPRFLIVLALAYATRYSSVVSVMNCLSLSAELLWLSNTTPSDMSTIKAEVIDCLKVRSSPPELGRSVMDR
jgi:hypothetical protein